ncbi:hypothetical protein BX667DRAFT_499885 [Coemansia mojavensis]|nr:hypothetical protein BX667DRAFT_499885 [Coemansia mojavensis]
MNWHLHNMPQTGHTLDKGAFSNLHYLSVELKTNSPFEPDAKILIKETIKSTVELSSTASVLKLPNYYYSELGSLKLDFPPCLQKLFMPSNPLHKDLTMVLFKLGYLQKAAIALNSCIDCSNKQDLSDEAIKECQQKLRGVGTCIHIVNISLWGAEFLRRRRKLLSCWQISFLTFYVYVSALLNLKSFCILSRMFCSAVPTKATNVYKMSSL